MTLDEIMIKNGTDKASKHPVFGHNYAPHYEKFFAPLREETIRFLEIGVGGGESIRAWLEYFPKARVWGVDKVSETNPWNTPHATLSPDPRYKFIAGDQTDETMWRCLAVDTGGNFDVVVDDGGHFNDEVITSFKGLWHQVRPGGLYCIEDLGVAYGAGTVFVRPTHPSHLMFLAGLIDKMNLGDNDVDSVYLSRELAIIRKKA